MLQPERGCESFPMVKTKVDEISVVDQKHQNKAYNCLTHTTL